MHVCISTGSFIKGILSKLSQKCKQKV